MRVRRSSRRLLLVSVAVAVCVALVGCEQVYLETGSASIKRSENNLIIAICDEQQIEALTVSGRIGNPTIGKVVNLVRLRGNGNLPNSYLYRLGDSIPGMSSLEVDEVRFSDLGLITIMTSSPNPPYGPLFRSWNISETGVPGDRWLRPDGTESVEPC